jgi:SAM-dependent methyltransferase
LPLSTLEWHQRYLQQAQWTRSLRLYLFEKLDIPPSSNVLDVGCGTGALEPELAEQFQGRLFGLDIDREALRLAHFGPGIVDYTQGDAFHLPYCGGAFDLTLCHFLLLWTAPPAEVVAEMRRVTRPDGYVLALAEPDYGGRIDFPESLAGLGEMQRAALRRQGADPFTGRRLRQLFNACGLEGVEAGVLGGQWSGGPGVIEPRAEWTILQADLQDVLSAQELKAYQQLDARAWENSSRVLYVPTFYAWGRVPK